MAALLERGFAARPRARIGALTRVHEKVTREGPVGELGRSRARNGDTKAERRRRMRVEYLFLFCW